MNKKNYFELYSEMLFIRLVDEMIAKKYREQNMRCPVHLSIGQEAAAVGVCHTLLKKDRILQFIELQIEKEVYSPETANSIKKTLLNEVSKNRKIKVEYDIENCVIKSIKI